MKSLSNHENLEFDAIGIYLNNPYKNDTDYGEMDMAWLKITKVDLIHENGKEKIRVHSKTLPGPKLSSLKVFEQLIKFDINPDNKNLMLLITRNEWEVVKRSLSINT